MTTDNKAKKRKEYVSVKIGEYKVKVKGAEKTKVVVSRMDAAAASRFGIKGDPMGVAVERTIKKGASSGAKYKSRILGSRGKGYGLVFNSIDTAAPRTPGQARNRNTNILRVPVPSGTPLAVIAEFANQKVKGKGKPTRIISPNGTSYPLNVNKSSGGG